MKFLFNFQPPSATQVNIESAVIPKRCLEFATLTLHKAKLSFIALAGWRGFQFQYFVNR